MIGPVGHSWKEFSDRRRLALIAFVGYLPFGIGVTSLSEALGLAETLPGLLIIVWFIFWIVSVVGVMSLRCPRCGETFYWGSGISNPFTRHCLHCGLRQGDRDFDAT